MGDEGGFAPPIHTIEEGLGLLVDAIESAGYTGRIDIALDAAASEFYKNGSYDLDFKTPGVSRVARVRVCGMAQTLTECVSLCIYVCVVDRAQTFCPLRAWRTFMWTWWISTPLFPLRTPLTRCSTVIVAALLQYRSPCCVLLWVASHRMTGLAGKLSQLVLVPGAKLWAMTCWYAALWRRVALNLSLSRAP